MTKARRVLVASAIAAAAAGTLAMPAAASADTGAWTYTSTLNPVNHSGGSGMLTLKLDGNKAWVTEHWSGLAATFNDGAFPHVQHIHGGMQGVCPTPSADKNGDGVISTPEGVPAYGSVLTTLSTSGDTSANAATNIKIAPSGSSTDYSRTITLDTATVSAIKNGTAVIVVHGLDPSTLSKRAQAEKSPLVPSLPLAATAPALCGALQAMPAAGPDTGIGSTAGIQDGGLFGIGGVLLAAAAGLFGLRRRFANAESKH